MTSLTDFKQLKRQVGIVDVLSAYQLTGRLSRKAGHLRGPCPVHGGDNPTAFRADLDRNIWHCFTACGGGDVIDLVRRIEGCDHAQAARVLQEIAPFHKGGATPGGFTKPQRRQSFTPFTFAIPLNPVHWFLQNKKKLQPETASRYEAGTTTRSAFLKGTVAVRLHDLQGLPLGYCGRRLDPNIIDRMGKWLFPRHFPKAGVLYNGHRAQQYRQHGIIVVECPWATMRIAQAGTGNVVSLLGSSASTRQIEWLAKAPKVLVMLDGDEAGRKGAERLYKAIAGDTTAVVHDLPDEMEPEDLPDEELISILKHHSFFLNQ